MSTRRLSGHRRSGSEFPPVTDGLVYHVNLENNYFDGIDDLLVFEPMTIRMPEDAKTGASTPLPATHCFWYKKEVATDIMVLMDASQGVEMRGMKVIIKSDRIWVRYGGNGQFNLQRRDYETGAIPVNNTNLHLLTIKPISTTQITIGIDGVEYNAPYVAGGFTGWNLLDTAYYHFMNNRNNYQLTGIPNFSRGWIYKFFQYNKYLSQAEMNQNFNAGI